MCESQYVAVLGLQCSVPYGEGRSTVNHQTNSRQPGQEERFKAMTQNGDEG